MDIQEQILKLLQMLQGGGGNAQPYGSIAPNIQVQPGAVQGRGYTPPEMQQLQVPSMMDLLAPEVNLPSLESSLGYTPASQEEIRKEPSIEEILTGTDSGAPIPPQNYTTGGTMEEYAPASESPQPSGDESPTDTVIRVAKEEGVDPAIALSFWDQESSRSTDLGLKGPTLEKGKWKGHYGRGPWQIMTFHGDIPNTFEGHTRWAMKHIKERGIEGYYGKGKVPGMPNMPSSKEYAQQVLNRADKIDARTASTGNKSWTDKSVMPTGFVDPDRPEAPRIDTSNRGAYEKALPPRGESLADKILKKFDNGDFDEATKTGFEMADSPIFQFFAGNTKLGLAFDRKHQELRDRKLKEHIADELPPYLRDIWRFNPKMAWEMAKYETADDVRENNRLWEARKADIGDASAREKAQILADQKAAGGGDWTNLSSTGKDWLMYKQIERTQGKEAADQYWNAVMNQKDPEHAYRLKSAEAQGRMFPQDMKDVYVQAKAYETQVEDALQTQNIIQKVYDLSGASGWPQVGAWLKETPQNQLRALAETLKGRITIEKMQALKDASKQGATGFGQITEKELTLLQNSLDAINLDSDPETLRSTLIEVMDHYMEVQRQKQLGYEELAAWYNRYNTEEYLQKPLPGQLDPNALKDFDPWSNIQKAEEVLRGGNRQGIARPPRSKTGPIDFDFNSL